MKFESRDCNTKEGNKYPVRNGYYPPASICYCLLKHTYVATNKVHTYSLAYHDDHEI